jgi:hypothetical protein
VCGREGKRKKKTLLSGFIFNVTSKGG